MMIQRHARLLLSTARLLALGRLAASLDLHLVAWLTGERERAARVDCAVFCLKKLHEEFNWPYPAATEMDCVRRDSVTPGKCYVLNMFMYIFIVKEVNFNNV